MVTAEIGNGHTVMTTVFSLHFFFFTKILTSKVNLSTPFLNQCHTPGISPGKLRVLTFCIFTQSMLLKYGKVTKSEKE